MNTLRYPNNCVRETTGVLLQLVCQCVGIRYVDPSREMSRRLLDFYGFQILVEWPEQLTLPAFSREFTQFDSFSEKSCPDLRLSLELKSPELSQFPFLRPRYATPRNICYHYRGQRLINYHGQALVVESADEAKIQILSESPEFIESVLYTVIIAKTGAHFDAINRFRIHGLAFAVDGKAYLVLLPMGGGKSTLLLQLLQDPSVKLISEDTPLLSGDGLIWPFPVKIGLLPGNLPKDIPPELVTRVRHLEGVEKEVVDLSYLGDRIVNAPLPLTAVYVGLRYLGKGTAFAKLSWAAKIHTAVRDCVVGVGVFQGLEFILSSSTWDLLRKCGLGLRRMRACCSIFTKAPCFEFQMGIDPAENAKNLLQHSKEICR